MPKQTLKFYNVRTKKSFTTNSYGVRKKNTKRGDRYLAITKDPNTGESVYRLISKENYKQMK